MFCHIKIITNLKGYCVLFEIIIFTINTIAQYIQWGLLCSSVSLGFLSTCIPQIAPLAQIHCIKFSLSAQSKKKKGRTFFLMVLSFCAIKQVLVKYKKAENYSMEIWWVVLLLYLSANTKRKKSAGISRKLKCHQWIRINTEKARVMVIKMCLCV